MPWNRPTWKDQLIGGWRSVRKGTGLSVVANYREGAAVRDERLAREAEQNRRYPSPSRRGGYYSRGRADGSVDVYIGPNGDITSERPHVHIVHSDPESRIIITATQSDGQHSHREHLPADASGNEVNAVVDRLRRELR